MQLRWISLLSSFFSLCLCASVVPSSSAHPVGLGIYERTIDVRLTREGVMVYYRLELTETTAVKDLLGVADGKELARLSKPKEHYEAFTRAYAPILAANLTAQLDGKDLQFTCIQHSHQVLDHLRCDFVFHAGWQLRPGQRQYFTFREDNYDREAGIVRLSLRCDPAAPIVQKSAPDEALRTKAASDFVPGDEERMRKASATIEAPVPNTPRPDPTPAPPEPEPAPPPSSELPSEDSLLRLFLNSEHGFWMMMILAVVLGAAHALTPGHGKTLVAGYLVGQRGTFWHALLLGLVTTLTHTGVVLVLAIALPLCFPQGLTSETQRSLDTALGLIGGALVAGLGLWLLFRRLGGQADHFHLPGHSHHHHPEPADHDDARPLSSGGGLWGLVVLGVQGGIVPCWDAVVVLLLAISRNMLGLALPLLLAFSAGLAAVLIAIGIGVVYSRRLAGARWGESRLFKALPLVSAVVITCLGLWLCYDRLHPRTESPSPPVHARP